MTFFVLVVCQVGDGKADTYFCCSSADGLTQFQSHLGNYNSCTHLVQQLKRPYGQFVFAPCDAEWWLCFFTI